MRNENSITKEAGNTNDSPRTGQPTEKVNKPNRTSNQGRKESSGGERNTNNRGHRKEGEDRM